MSVTVEVKGLRELRARLRQLPLDVRRKVANKAVGKAARLVKRAAVAATPLGATGTLRRAAITNYRRKDSTDDKTVYIVTYRRGKRFRERISKRGKRIANRDAFYAPFVEFGHRIVPRRSRGVKSLKIARAGPHRRVPGRHFLRDAFATQVQPAIDAMAGELRAYFATVRP